MSDKMVLLSPIWNRRNYMGIRGYKRGRFQNNIEKSNAVKLSLSSIKSCFDLYKLVLRKYFSRLISSAIMVDHSPSPLGVFPCQCRNGLAESKLSFP
jgi:hypothetical protein